MMRISLLVSSMLLVLIIGCSGGSPLAPQGTPPVETPREAALGSPNHVLWGMWDITIDGKSMTAEAVPIRGAQFTCNVTMFMQPPKSPINMIALAVLPGSEPMNGYFEVDVTLRHPFPGLNMYNGFDVRGILMADGSIIGSHDSNVLRAGPGDTSLVNADGYTRWWNYPEFTTYETIFGFTRGKLGPPNHPTATVNPYKYFALGLDPDTPVTDLDVSTRGFFPTLAGTQTRTYKIQFKMNGGQTVFDFQYAVDASWDDPDKDYAPDFPQEAFSLSANCHEAWTLSVNDAGSTAYWLNADEKGGEFVLDIEVYDWQAAVNPGGVPAEVSGLWLEGDVLGGAVDALSVATILPGSTSVSSVFEVTLGSLNLTKSGPETLFCTVESANPSSYEPQIPGGSSFAYPEATLAAYFTFDATVSGEAPYVQPTVLSIDPDWGWADEAYTDVTVTGTDFAPGCTVDLEYAPGDTLELTNLQYVDSTTLTFDLDLFDATIGLYDVIVTNPVAAPGVLVDGFEVKLFEAMWPVTQGNPQHTGTIGFDGPNGPANGNFAPAWFYTFADVAKGNATPVFLNDTTIFFCIPFNYLDTNHLPAIAVDMATHATKWTKVFNTTTHSAAVFQGLSEDGSIALLWDWPSYDLYGVDAENGDTLWGPVAAASGSSDGYATLDQDGNFIVNSGSSVRSIDPDTGSINWTCPLASGGYCTPAVGTDGTIYAYGNWLSNAQLHAIDPSTGTEKWVTYGMGRCDNGVVFNPVTEKIIVFSQGGLYCWQDNGSSCSLYWHVSMSYAWYCSPSVAPNGDIYLIDGGGTMRRIDPSNGSTLNSSPGYEGGYGNRIAIGDNGLIYVNNEAYFRCANSNCSLKWSYYGDYYSYWSAPAIGQDGTVYSARRTSGLCAWHD